MENNLELENLKRGDKVVVHTGTDYAPIEYLATVESASQWGIFTDRGRFRKNGKKIGGAFRCLDHITVATEEDIKRFQAMKDMKEQLTKIKKFDKWNLLTMEEVSAVHEIFMRHE